MIRARLLGRMFQRPARSRVPNTNYLSLPNTLSCFLFQDLPVRYESTTRPRNSTITRIDSSSIRSFERGHVTFSIQCRHSARTVAGIRSGSSATLMHSFCMTWYIHRIGKLIPRLQDVVNRPSFPNIAHRYIGNCRYVESKRRSLLKSSLHAF